MVGMELFKNMGGFCRTKITCLIGLMVFLQQNKTVWLKWKTCHDIMNPHKFIHWSDYYLSLFTEMMFLSNHFVSFIVCYVWLIMINPRIVIHCSNWIVIFIEWSNFIKTLAKY